MSQPVLLEIDPVGALDRIHVYWLNVKPGVGYVTVTCFGAAWTAFFGGMSGDTIQQFFARADTSYLVSKLGGTQWLKATKRHDQYLERVVETVKAALRVQCAPILTAGTNVESESQQSPKRTDVS